jgi:Mrp family chromosome partitioning ATPase
MAQAGSSVIAPVSESSRLRKSIELGEIEISPVPHPVESVRRRQCSTDRRRTRPYSSGDQTVNDSDQTVVIPVAEARGEPHGSTARKLFANRTGSVATSAVINGGPDVPDAEPSRFEPTVFGAVRRYRGLVLASAFLVMAGAAGYSLVQAKVYQASANVTVPLPVSSQVAQADPGQYLDNQVLILQSGGVARRAAQIADQRLGGNRLDAADFFTGRGGSLAVSPPATVNPGSYGASIVAVSFKGPSAQVARVGLNALLQAFREAVSGTVKAQANATIMGIDRAIRQTSSPSEQSALVNQRTQTVVNEQTDLARVPTAAVLPTTRANGQWVRNGVIGLLAGIILGAALAFWLAHRRRDIAARQDPAAIYGVPMIAETAAFKAGPARWSKARGSKARGSKEIPGGGRLPMATEPDSAVAESFRFAAGSVERACTSRGRASLAFISPLTGAGKSTVVANLAVAMAEGGTRLLVVDADAADDGLTAMLLPGVSVVDGFEHVLDGRRPLSTCVRPSPLNHAIAVLGSRPSAPRHVTGAARSRAAAALLAEARSRFDLVLIDTPALLQVADATELLSAADAAIIVVNPDDRIADHLETADRLKPLMPSVAGYLYNRAPARSYAAARGPARTPIRLAPDVRPNFVTEVRPSLVTAQARDTDGHTMPLSPRR